MEFDKSRVYTSLNADELKVGSKVICSFSILDLKMRVNEGEKITKVHKILSEESVNRICVYFDNDGYFNYSLAYLISEPEENKLKWTDLKIGDVIRKKYEDGYRSAMVTRIDTYLTERHIGLGGEWLTDDEIEEWEKVE